jgi:hypothetical protein
MKPERLVALYPEARTRPCLRLCLGPSSRPSLPPAHIPCSQSPSSQCSKISRNVHRSEGPLLLVLLLVAALFASCTRMEAQAVFGSIVGTATDSTGAVIPNATIVVTDVSKGTSQTVQSTETATTPSCASSLIPTLSRRPPLALHRLRRIMWSSPPTVPRK